MAQQLVATALCLGNVGTFAEAKGEIAPSPLIHGLSFTGSTGIGKVLTKLAAGTMKAGMELSGNAPFAFGDTDPEPAAALQIPVFFHEPTGALRRDCGRARRQ